MGKNPRQGSRPGRRASSSTSPRPPAGGESEDGRARLRRNRPLTKRAALLLLVPLALLAAASDVALYRFVTDHYARHGDLGLPLDLALMALTFTGMTVYGGIAFLRGLRSSARPKRVGNSAHTPSATRRSRTKKEQT